MMNIRSRKSEWIMRMSPLLEYVYAFAWRRKKWMVHEKKRILSVQDGPYVSLCYVHFLDCFLSISKKLVQQLKYCDVELCLLLKICIFYMNSYVIKRYIILLPSAKWWLTPHKSLMSKYQS
jgi:hypothetical protein